MSFRRGRSNNNNIESTNRSIRGAEIPPPPSLTSGRQNKGSFTLHHNSSSKTFVSPNFEEGSIKKLRSEDDYFNEEDDETKDEFLPYIPAPGSPAQGVKDVNKEEEDDEEDDPLDAFMENLERDALKKGLESSKAVRDDIEKADDEESYYKWLEENPEAGKNIEDEEDFSLEYDEDGNPLVPIHSKMIDPLPPIDHSLIHYKAFEKNFYTEHSDISSLSPIQVIDLLHKLDIHVSGVSKPRPVSSFAHFGFDDTLLKAIRRADYSTPTPIQAMAIPVILSGRDVIGIAKTGSGKTAAFLWPMIVHIMNQEPLKAKEGPIGLILAPTRELSLQIYNEAKKFGKIYNLRVVCAYGGGSKWEQSKAFEAGAEIAVGTPGRMIDMITMKVTNLERVTYLVLDEADRMFDMGFETQVRSICDHVRPERQTLLFSATFKKKIERLCRESLNDPIKIVQGSIGEASEHVTQKVLVLPQGGHKWNWLLEHLIEFTSNGSVLIFVTKKQNCEELAHNLQVKEFDCKLLHGDLNQIERNEIIHTFKKKDFLILVATDVAARGLDIPHIRTVINFDIARDIETHTHRIGRTGRAGVKGNAYTLVTDKDKEFVGHIVRNLEQANQDVPQELMDLALQSSWFASSRFKKKSGGGNYTMGLGYSENSTISTSSNSIPVLYKPLTGSDKGGKRFNTVKQAYKNQFMSHFTKASQDTTTSSASSSLKRKSRWD